MAQLKINNDITTEKRKIVIIGKSGSGKSVLLGKLRQQYHDTSIFIPSARSVHNLNTNLQEINSMEHQAVQYANGRGYVHNTDTLFISKLFFKDYNEMDEKRRDKKIADKDYILLLNTILKQVSHDFHEIQKSNFQLTNTGGYELKKASDGEKHTIVLICAILSAPQDAILFIDEPEIGIHNAAIRALFDALEEERSDCTFVYATHNLDFAKTREDADVFYISKNNTNYQEPNIKKMSDDTLERDILIDINGTPKPILLVEGKETDKKLYSKIFKEYEVRNGDGCGQIKARVKAVRDFFGREDVFGLLDGDNRNQTEIDDLKRDGCFCIPFAQHEHLYILPDIISVYLKDLNKTDIKADAILIEIIKTANDFGEHFIKDANGNDVEDITIKNLALSIADEKGILDFLKQYRGKDLIGKVVKKIGLHVKDDLLRMTLKKECVEKIDAHLSAVKANLK